MKGSQGPESLFSMYYNPSGFSSPLVQQQGGLADTVLSVGWERAADDSELPLGRVEGTPG